MEGNVETEFLVSFKIFISLFVKLRRNIRFLLSLETQPIVLKSGLIERRKKHVLLLTISYLSI